jgi:hypothetical protein
MIANEEKGFWVAPFGIDGRLEGIGFWRYSQMSSRWCLFCKEIIARHGTTFDRCLDGDLVHIGMKFTSSDGTALITMRDSGELASSILLLSGKSPNKELEIAKMFTTSLGRSRLVVAASKTDKAFAELFNISERPLVVVVPWPDTVSADYELIRELGLHFAAAFFCKDLDDRTT